jgi:hypothetical protein
MSFTPAQQGKYRPIVNRAWHVHCDRTSQAPNAPLAFRCWYEQQLMEVLGVPTTRNAGHKAQFEICMLWFAQIAGEDREIAYWSSAAERTMQYLITQRLDELSWLEHRPHDWRYARAIYAHMNLPLSMDEAPAMCLWKVFQALDIHVARECRKRKLSVWALPTRHRKRKAAAS